MTTLFEIAKGSAFLFSTPNVPYLALLYLSPNTLLLSKVPYSFVCSVFIS